jgi:hypothetical protein
MLRRYNDIDATPFIRTDFSDDALWAIVSDLAARPYEDDFAAIVEFVNDPAWQSWTPARFLSGAANGYRGQIIFLADATTMQDDEHPIICVGFGGVVPISFRVIPSQLWSVENNLRLCNMDFKDFSALVDGDGVFRGFN